MKLTAKDFVNNRYVGNAEGWFKHNMLKIYINYEHAIGIAEHGDPTYDFAIVLNESCTGWFDIEFTKIEQ